MPEDFELLWLFSAVTGSLVDAGGTGVAQATSNMVVATSDRPATTLRAREKQWRLWRLSVMGGWLWSRCGGWITSV